MTAKRTPASLRGWRNLPADPIDVDRFVRALNAVAEPFRQSAGRLAPALGQTRLLVPLTLFLRLEYKQGEIVSILLRLQALQVLFQEGALGEWVSPDAEDEALLDVHPAAVAAAATLPLDEDDRFEAGAFLDQLREIAPMVEAAGAPTPIKVPAP